MLRLMRSVVRSPGKSKFVSACLIRNAQDQVLDERRIWSWEHANMSVCCAGNGQDIYSILGDHHANAFEVDEHGFLTDQYC